MDPKDIYCSIARVGWNRASIASRSRFGHSLRVMGVRDIAENLDLSGFLRLIEVQVFKLVENVALNLALWSGQFDGIVGRKREPRLFGSRIFWVTNDPRLEQVRL